MSKKPIPEEELDALINQHQQSQGPSEQELDALISRDIADQNSALPEAEAALQGFGKESTFGYLPEMQAGVYQGLESGADALGLLPEGYETETYDQTLAGMKGRQEALKEQSPYAFGAGQVAGTFAGPGSAMMKGAGKLAKGSGAVANLAKGALGEGALGQRILGGATSAGIEGGLYNPEEGQSRLENAAIGAGLGGFGAEAVNLGLKGAGSLLKGVGKAPGWVGKKTMTTLLGAEERNIKKYMENPELINNAKSLPEVKDRVDDMIRPIRQELADAQIDEKEALSRLKETERIVSGEFKDKGKELRSAFSSAKDRLNRANKSSIDTMNRVLPPLHLTDAVVDSLDNLKTQVRKGSSDALDELQREVKSDLNITEATEVVESILDNMTVRGRILDFDQGAAKQIKAIQDDLESYAGVMSPHDIKKYIKSLDRSIDISDVAGTFNDSPTQAKVALRRYLDSVIKEASPSYAAFMTAVADDMQTLTNARRYFGTPDKAAKKLSSIMSPTNREARDSLLKLADRTGTDFKTPLLEYQNTKNLLAKQKMEAAARGEFDTDLARDLPEWQDYDVAKNQLKRFNERSTQKVREMQERIVSRSKAAEQAELAVQRNKDAQEAVDALGSIYESNSEDKIRRLVSFFNSGEKGKGLAVRQEFEKLSALEDEDFVQMIEGLAAAGSFDKSFLRGSRNVNLWGAMTMAAQSGMSSRAGAGGAAGAILGGPVGIGVGAAWGAIIDQYGPKMAKGILDQVLRIKGLPTVQKISKLNLPQNVKNELTKQMRAFIYAGSANVAVQIAPEDIPHIKEDLRRDTSLSNADKAKKISHLNRTGELVDPDTIYEPYDPLEDLKKKDLFTNKFKDTGREVSSFDYGEALDSYVGAPFREAVSGIAEGKPRSGLRNAVNRFGKDPQEAPTYDRILAKMGMEEGVGRDVAALAANLLEPGIPGAALGKFGKLPISASVKKLGKAVNKLPMDDISRMARAEKLGFDTSQVLTHGTPKKFDSFKASRNGMFGPGVYFFKGDGGASNFGENVIKSFARRDKILDVHAHDTVDKARSLMKELDLPTGRLDKTIKRAEEKKANAPKKLKEHKEMLAKKGKSIDKKQEKGLLKMFQSDSMLDRTLHNADMYLVEAVREKFPDSSGVDAWDKLVEILQSKGYKGKEALWNDSPINVIFDPKDIRKTKAAFDPAKADSSVLMSGGIGSVGKNKKTAALADKLNKLTKSEAEQMVSHAREGRLPLYGSGSSVDAYDAGKFVVKIPKSGSAQAKKDMRERFYKNSILEKEGGAADSYGVGFKSNDPVIIQEKAKSVNEKDLDARDIRDIIQRKAEKVSIQAHDLNHANVGKLDGDLVSIDSGNYNLGLDRSGVPDKYKRLVQIELDKIRTYQNIPNDIAEMKRRIREQDGDPGLLKYLKEVIPEKQKMLKSREKVINKARERIKEKLGSDYKPKIKIKREERKAIRSKILSSLQKDMSNYA